MLFDDTYRTIEKPAEGIFRDRGSKFLAFAYPITSEGEIKEILSKLKAGHPKANHHCWAMRLGIDRSVFRLNDDGEPSGTAGRPILNTLLSRDLTNIIVIVVRYFGGTLLGVPGLINAYKSATTDALAGVVVVEKTVNDVYSVSFDHTRMNDVMKVVKEEGLTVIKQSFEANCVITLAIRKTLVTASWQNWKARAVSLRPISNPCNTRQVCGITLVNNPLLKATAVKFKNHCTGGLPNCKIQKINPYFVRICNPSK